MVLSTNLKSLNNYTVFLFYSVVKVVKQKEIFEKLDLVGLKENVREMLIKENLSRDQKTTLLKIKLDAIFTCYSFEL